MCCCRCTVLCPITDTRLVEIASTLLVQTPPSHETSIHDGLINMFSKAIIPQKLNLIDTKLNLTSKILNLMHMKSNLEWACFFTCMSGEFIHIHLKWQLQCEAGLWESLCCVLCDSVDHCITLLIMAARGKYVAHWHLLERWQWRIYLHNLKQGIWLESISRRWMEEDCKDKVKLQSCIMPDSVGGGLLFVDLIRWSKKTKNSWTDGQRRIRSARSGESKIQIGE